ncbi:MAG: hydroxysqualene dehydroxylase [Pseudonocardiales bacterium]|nr:hydroxysqualene dehydroxylase [Pseudonocardiales bacterium]
MADAPTVVVGGGLAGVSAALRLADLGRPVVLVEKRPRLGGAAFSFPRAGLWVDNGQHVFLRCCSAYRWFLDRIGATGDVVLQDALDIPVLAPDGRRARLRRTPGLPAPVHLTAALARYGVLSPLDRARAVRGALALRFLDPGDRRLDERTLGGFLRAHGQNDATIAALWGIVATATLNLDPDEASLALAAKVFRTGLLDSAPAGDVGYAAVPLGRLHDDAAAKALADAGVEVLTDAAVRSVTPAGPVQVETADGPRTIAAHAAVLALPHREAFRVTPSLAQTAAAPAAGLGASPILNVHVVYDRRVTELGFAAAVDSPVQWFFDRTDGSGLAAQRPGAQYLAVTVSAAAGLIDEPSRSVLDRFLPELARLLPRAGAAHIVDAFVTRERRATFRQAAGSWAMRPRPTDGPDGVLLAGAWTDTGWPDTMEGAVRSGVAAADAAAGTPPHEIKRFPG